MTAQMESYSPLSPADAGETFEIAKSSSDMSRTPATRCQDHLIGRDAQSA
jgi:hypothetical protein